MLTTYGYGNIKKDAAKFLTGKSTLDLRNFLKANFFKNSDRKVYSFVKKHKTSIQAKAEVHLH